ncbi:cysteine-rich receptor-like protein kinase 28 [Phtheirospermum japonicum]|uniref:non-specific serine/threonine protein kinase n=1 Tax=Phtheirospermum japonicum TaxID=374723 RepID=A0A830B2P2_9LAMI|nr:cysteine-rich receptor-like protein kinase 28 [Phtheirospermum japonicum]
MNFANFDWYTITAATNQFSPENKVGLGGYGLVYKRLSTSSSQGLAELKNEVLLLPKLQHGNLIKLLGYCIHGEEKLLVYEFMENLSLDTFIFERQFLPWPVRSKIITGIARGLVYLHRDSGLGVVLRELKSSNVLLDREMDPKISNFAFATLDNQSEMETSRVVVGFAIIVRGLRSGI